jgi:hypothetical protein
MIYRAGGRKERTNQGREGAGRYCFGNRRFVSANSYEYVLRHRLADVTLGLKLDRRGWDIHRSADRLSVT